MENENESKPMNQPPTHPSDPQAAIRDRNRLIMAGCTVLLAAGILAMAFGPLSHGASNPGINQSTHPPSSTPGNTVPSKHPDPSPGPSTPGSSTPSPSTPGNSTSPFLPGQKPAPTQPLPDRPASEPSMLVVHGDRSCKQIALTYDAGSGANGAAAILDVLQKHQVTSTFFLTGKWVETYPDLAKRIAAEGHEIANHTYSHPDLTKLSPDQVIKQIQDGEAAIRRVTGKETLPLFREPYGAFNKAEQVLVRRAGYSYSIYWDVDTLDWQFPPVATIVSRITTKAQNGSIVLSHLNVPDTALAADRAIPMLRANGYELVTISQLLQCHKP